MPLAAFKAELFRAARAGSTAALRLALDALAKRKKLSITEYAFCLDIYVSLHVNRHTNHALLYASLLHHSLNQYVFHHSPPSLSSVPRSATRVAARCYMRWCARRRPPRRWSV